MPDANFLDSKISAYLNQVIEADKAGDKTSRLRSARMLMVLTRMEARTSINKMVEHRARLNAAKHSMAKANEQGIFFPTGVYQIMKMELRLDNLRELVASSGGMVCAALDIWQIAGATLRDLCNLCNRDYEQVLKEIPPENHSDPLKELIFIYNLDFKDNSNRGWIDYGVDAPLTHSIKDHYLKLITSTPEARTAANDALRECYPNIWDSRVYTYVDEDGEEHMIDADGVELGELD